jgi:hypothetical protein
MPQGHELAPDVRVVVDFAVEDDPDRAVFVRERLLAGAQIDDAEPAVGKGRVRIAVQARFVRPAMSEDVAHGRRAHRRVGSQPVNSHQSSYAAHAGLSEQAECHGSSGKEPNFSLNSGAGYAEWNRRFAEWKFGDSPLPQR